MGIKSLNDSESSPKKVRFWQMILFTAVYTVGVTFYFYVILHDFAVCLLLAGGLYPYAFSSFVRYAESQNVKKIEIQFGEALRFMASSLSAGATVANSIYEFVSKADTYGRRDLSLINDGFREMTGKMDLHMSVYDAFEQFAKKSGSSDIKTFSLALSQICISGGDEVSLVRNTASALRIKRETEDEIDIILAGPKYNHRLITVMPVLIIFLMGFISPDYMETLHYGIGKTVAVIAAVFIVIAYIIGSRLSDIRL